MNTTETRELTPKQIDLLIEILQDDYLRQEDMLGASFMSEEENEKQRLMLVDIAAMVDYFRATQS